VNGEGANALGITSDSRAVAHGGAFVALRGERHDGHDHLAEAAAQGAVLLVVARGHGRALPLGPDVVEVDDTLDAWGNLAAAHLRAWRRAPRREPARVIAVTGSAGKTTTKELCASLLGAVAPTHATQGNLNNRVGVPAVIFGLEAHHRFAVLELGMSVRGEIRTLAAMACPDVGILTNVGVAHAEGVGGTRGDVAREKGELFAALSESGVAVANADDAAVLGELARTRAQRVATFGRSRDATYRLDAREPLAEKGSVVVVVRPAPSPPLQVTLPFVGEAAAIDFAAALAACEAASGWSFSTAVVASTLADQHPLAGRASVSMVNGFVLVDDTYNANPASVRAALSTLSELARAKSARAVLVLGEMKELGPAAAAEHASLGDAIVQAGVALAIGCGGLAGLALDRAAQGGVQVIAAADAAAAAREAVRHVVPGDVVLVKGSRSVGAEAVVAALGRGSGLGPGERSGA
jgi:UDP-N-acetylmuramoyl-tripeptide--D-alanyl-D-alanine ligase